MSTESAFNKRLTEETTMDQVEGVLEHFNLPPKTIAFIRKNQRMIVVAIGIIVIAVVAWSLYGSYVEKQREAGATALSLAMEVPDGEKSAALTGVIEKYGNTTSATWAEVELAHLDMRNGDFDGAAAKYSVLAQKTKDSNPLKALAIYGVAQAYEAEKKYSEAEKQYNTLKEIKGYAALGYIGLGRLEEAQGNIDKAIAVLNNVIIESADDPSFSQIKSVIENKIARLKALQ